jgi:tetratricopeptide (TPR) repeat protein
MARAALVTAPAGAGKSRLRHELLERLRARGERFEIFTARGDAMHAGAPLASLLAAVRRSAGAVESDSAPVRREKLRARIGRRLPPADAERIASVLDDASQSSRSTQARLPAAREDPHVVAQRVRAAWEDWLRAETSVQPVIILLDDLHWGDLPSVRLVDGALRALRDRPLFVLGFARPEVHAVFPSLWSGREAQEIRLGALPRRACERLVRDALGPDVAAERVQWLVRRSDGHAFLLEELIRIAAEGRTDAADVPDTVLGVLQARLDALGVHAKRSLRAASVFGETFWTGGVLELVGAEVDVAHALDDLVANEVVERRASSSIPGQEELVFRHALVRDAAYAMLVDRDRAAAHRTAATWLEGVGARDPIALARHWQHAGDPVRAARGYARAAFEALDANDPPQALRLADEGLACAPTGELLGDLRLVQTIGAHWRGHHAEAVRLGAEARALLPRGDARWLRGLSEAMVAAARLGDAGAVETLTADLRDVDVGTESRDALVVALSRCFIPLSNLGRTALALETFARASVIAATVASPSLFARAQLLEAGAFERMVHDDPAGAVDRMTRALDAYEAAGARTNLCQSATSAAWMFVAWGDFVRADRSLDRARLLAAELESPQLAVWVRHLDGELLLARGRFDEARTTFEEVTAEYRRHGNARQAGWSLASHASALLSLGDAAAAEDEAARAHDLAAPHRAFQIWIASIRTAALLELGRVDEALAVAPDPRTFEPPLWIPHGAGIVGVAFARALLAAGRREEAESAIRSARARLREVAARIDDPAWRAGYLALPQHASTLALARVWLDE